MDELDPDKQADDAGVARVLQAAGRRAQPPAALADQIRAAVHAEWRAMVGERQRGRQRRRVAVGSALAAAVSIAAVALWSTRPLVVEPAAIIASVERVTGTVTRGENGAEAQSAIAEQQSLRVGQQLVTKQDGRVAIRIADGVSVRLDHDTRVTLAAADHLTVSAGAVYVDSGITGSNPAPRPGLQIETPVGIVRHLGTQYEVRLMPPGVRVAVREGRVEMTPETGSTVLSEAGEQLLFPTNGQMQRESIARHSPAWDWTGEIAPSFSIDSRPLSEFLDWVSRELGLEIVFATPQGAAEATRVVLRGSVTGLAPDEALAAVLSTTSLRSVERDGRIVLQ